MVIEGITLTMILHSLPKIIQAISYLGTLLRTEYVRVQRILQKLNKWLGMLQKIHAVTRDAEQRRVNGDSAVSLWLDDLLEVAFDMEDLLDGLTNEVCKKDLRSPGVLSIRQMEPAVEDIDSRLDDIFQQLSLLSLCENPETGPSSFHGTTDSEAQVPTSLTEEVFFGREKEMEELIVRLTRVSAVEQEASNYSVIPIVGMGGVGKSALAQQLYNHEEVEAFGVRAWAHVSCVFDCVAITKSILEAVAPSVSCEGKDLNWLQVTLKSQLSRKRFLIVLDDVWSENYSLLDTLLNPLHSGDRGSRVLVTTRNLQVAKLVGDPTRLSFLNTDDCLSVLAYHAIRKENFETHPHLKEFAAQLAEKCKGLPLAAKTIGGLLHQEDNVHKWRKILDVGIWKMHTEANNIPAALKLSYAHLPTRLKRCFAACALFPKGYAFDREELVRLWISQDLLVEGKPESYRQVGIDYFHELEARSFFLRVRRSFCILCMISYVTLLNQLSAIDISAQLIAVGLLMKFH